MRVIPFGTSSGRPTRHRNVSGLAVDLGTHWILVDCGEGTQQQVMRSPLKLSRLGAILLTHLHGDHVLGLPGLLGTIGLEGRTAPLHLVAAEGVGRWLDVMCELPILGLDFPLTITELVDDTLEGSSAMPRPVAEIDGVELSALPLRHRVPCFGYRLAEPERPGRLDVAAARAAGVADGPDMGRLQRGETVMGAEGPVDPAEVVGPTRPGRVVTVLGDTTRCDASVDLARDADLLVHEVTYAAAEESLAEQWRHSTSTGAAGVACAAGAKRLLITHFSSRYVDEQALLDEARAVFANTVAAVELEPVDV
jgi:ribonuclease Z